MRCLPQWNAASTIAVANKELIVAAGELLVAAAARSGSHAAAGRQRAQRDLSMLSRRRSPASVAAIVLDRVGRPVLARFARRDGTRRPRCRARPSDLADGHEEYDRLGHDDEQGPGSHRSQPLVRRSGRAGAIRRSSAVDRARLRDFYRRQRQSPVGRAGHAPADRLRARLSGTVGRRPGIRRGQRAFAARGGLRRTRACDTISSRRTAERFPCVRLAYEALAAGGTMPAVLSAANEVAVGAFVEGRIAFGQIADIIEGAMGGTERGELDARRRAGRGSLGSRNCRSNS